MKTGCCCCKFCFSVSLFICILWELDIPVDIQISPSHTAGMTRLRVNWHSPDWSTSSLWNAPVAWNYSGVSTCTPVCVQAAHGSKTGHRYSSKRIAVIIVTLLFATSNEAILIVVKGIFCTSLCMHLSDSTHVDVLVAHNSFHIVNSFLVSPLSVDNRRVTIEMCVQQP